MKNVFVHLLVKASNRLKELTDPACFGSPYESDVIYEKQLDFKKYFGFRKKMGFRI